MSLKILKPGLLTTIQDTGRLGYRQAGITTSGATDLMALRLANLLVANPSDAPALEITLTGPTILFEVDCLLALTGANLGPTINGQPVKMCRPVYVTAGSLLAFQKPISGYRAYLAVASSFKLPQILGSYATYLRAALGGLQGKALQTNNIIPLNQPAAIARQLMLFLQKKAANTGFAAATWTLNASFYPNLAPNAVIRVIKGPEYEWFTPEAQRLFWETPFRVTPESDRMGGRLQGPVLHLRQPQELLSTAVTFGTVQVPPRGNPIVLLSDHQTTGGYPRLAQVITADFSVLAQVKPGALIWFKEINLPEAQQLLLAQESKLENLKKILNLKFKYLT
ncbi:5-oxoprolinase subunit C family protein [Adhaeribacter rhizoryzae]|uniref:Biotin-dependent carboxyltransferase family protein n=1 Tax=Adhaeribacter rhizoryzae TaxID=2607907 RepID=A0A5M6DAM1_9BACT|nr:biotin-dependent carboxyltransferase family protein [Adhaeribacter rhizoryzae]KAA5543450.1 biotin-dependent carboxyltransferase family protein [Adhaeribacter rhizoryzae]